MLDAYIHQARENPPEVVTRFDHPPYQQLFAEIVLDRWLVERVDRLARPEGFRFCDIEDPEHEHPIIMCRPTLTAGTFALRTQYAKTVTLVNYASGTTPHWLTPIIQKLTQNGVPVFLVADCPGDQAGITKIAYGACLPALEAGATIIEKVNVRDAQIVKEAAKDWSEQLEGRALADYIRRMFAYQEKEKRPALEWETVAGIERYRVEVVRPMLQRCLGFDLTAAERISQLWATEPISAYVHAIETEFMPPGNGGNVQ